MHYSYISAAFLALASTVVGQDLFDAIQTPQRDEVLPAGKPFDLVWNPLDVKGTATIRLLQGATNISLQLGPVLKAGIDNQAGKYSWTPEDLGFATYGWTITLDSDKTKTQTSPPFSIKKANGGSSSTTTIQLTPGPSYTTTPTISTIPTSFSPSVTSTGVSTSGTPASNQTSSSFVRTPTSSPTTSPPASSSSAAMANIVSGGFVALGGALMAFVL